MKSGVDTQLAFLGSHAQKQYESRVRHLMPEREAVAEAVPRSEIDLANTVGAKREKSTCRKRYCPLPDTEPHWELPYWGVKGTLGGGGGNGK